MKLESEALLRPQEAAAPAWRPALAVLGVALAALLAIYWPTAKSMAAIWDSSQTYTHGYVIVPIALFLIWRRRHELAALGPRPDLLGLVMLACAGFAWLVAAAAGVQVLAQYAMVAMVPAVVVALAGREVGWRLAFPLAFLLFAVPFGEAFIPRLMDWTADFAVAAVQVSGVPVYREGTFFDLPSGRWSVVEACSGIRYLVASLTVGTLYAYLSYRALWKRAAFVALSIVVPVFANFVRAYLIVMIGHLSSMKLAVGIDHLIYGWIFFGVVMFALFWVGSYWREAPAAPAHLAVTFGTSRARPARFAVAALAIVALAGAWPLYASRLERESTVAVALAAPQGLGGWTAEQQFLTDWRPHYGGAKASVFQVYRKGEQAVALYLGYYRDQRQGAELVSSQNMLATSHDPIWQRVGEMGRMVPVGARAVEVRQTRLRSAGQRLVAWDWYRIGARDTANPYLAKALLARDRLLERGDDSVAIILAAPYAVRSDAAERALGEFARDMLPAIDAALAQARKAAP